MKKIISILLSFVLFACCTLAFAGCSKNDNNTYDLVLITDGASISDKSYNQSAWDGVKAYAEENKMTYRYYQPNLEEDGTLKAETISDYIDLAAKNGAKFIVLPGEDFAVAAYEVAPTYKDINFILIDALPHSQDSEAIRQQSNVMCISFDELQAGFLAGYSSVIDGYTKLGYLGTVNHAKSGGYGAGYAQGAAYAADQAGIPVSLEYANYDAADLNYDYSISIKPVYKKVSEQKEATFKVKVIDGIGSGVYTDGENVSVSALPAPEGKAFDHWEVKSDTEGVKDKKVNISTKKEPTMNLLVGDCDCTITAVWKDADTVPVSIAKDTAQSAVAETINAEKNSKIWVTAPAAEPGLVFDHWEDAGEGVIEDVKASATNVNVADKAMTLIPVYTKSDVPTFKVNVEQGTGSGSYIAGDKINVVADAPEDGYMFYKWENIDAQGLSAGISMENEYCYTTSFEMVDRFASVAEKMYDSGTQVVFAGGNPKSDSVFTATNNFDFETFVFGSGIDEGSKGHCLASVVNDYGAAVKLALKDFKGASIFKADASNDCIYVTGKNFEQYQLDEDGNVAKDKDGKEIENEDYNKDYVDAYNALKDGKIKLTPVQSGADVRKTVSSKCLTINFWINE